MEVQVQQFQSYESSSSQVLKPLPTHNNVSPLKSSKMEVKKQRNEDYPTLPENIYPSANLFNKAVKSLRNEDNNTSTNRAVKPPRNNNNSNNAMLKATVKDNKEEVISLASSSHVDEQQPFDRAMASRLLHLSCEFDSVNTATALLNGEVNGVVPVVNEVEEGTGYAPLHTAAEHHSLRCIELIVRKRGRTDMRTRKGGGTSSGKAGRGLLALELALRSVRLEVKWGPGDALDDLLLMLSEKDLGAIKVLAEKTKELGEVAYTIAMEGRVAALAALLMVAADKVNGSVLEVRTQSEVMAGKMTVYNCVIREAISIFSRSQCKGSVAGDSESDAQGGASGKERRKLLIQVIELLHFFGASVTNSGCVDQKVTSPLILASKAGDEAVLELLLKTGIDVNAVDAEGNSALHWSLKTSKVSSPEHLRMLLLLLKHGARVKQKDKLGLTAVHIAAGNGNLEALEILLSKEPDSVHVKSALKETPLFLAAKNNLIECAQLLLRCGASTDVHNLRRERPIELAKSQDMRSALNRTSIVITNRASQQKYTTRIHNDEVVSETCETLLKEAWCSSESVDSSSDSDICKYYTSATGCIRGSKCFYRHGEEELPKSTSRFSYARSIALQEFNRKIFVGGLPPAIDSESLACVVEERFGPVLDAKVLEMEIDGQVHSRGFGFVTFKHEQSVAAAIEAHYTNIWGKKVEIKTAVPRCLRSEEDYGDEPQQDIVQEEISPNHHQESSLSDKGAGDDKHEQMSWADRVGQAQPEPLIESKPRRQSSTGKDMPGWFNTLQKWLPNFLRKMARNSKEEFYSLSSLKTDFQTIFGIELRHGSLGYSKLSEFVKAFPELCSVQMVHTGGKVANHMILLPPKVSRPKPMVVLGKKFLESCPATPVHRPDDGKSHTQKVQKDPLPSECESIGVIKRASDNETHSSSIFVTNLGAAIEKKEFVETNPKESKKLSAISTKDHARFLQFLTPDPIFLARTWLGTGGFKRPDENFRQRHLVLENLACRRKEVFFLRGLNFYDDYAASFRQGNCFACGEKRLVWANYPCEHHVWCTECKITAMNIAAVGTPSHKCVVCDHIVEKIDLIPWSKQQIQSYDHMEFPPIHAALQSQRLRA